MNFTAKRQVATEAPERVETRIGTLEFTHDFANGYPTDACRWAAEWGAFSIWDSSRSMFRRRSTETLCIRAKVLPGGCGYKWRSYFRSGPRPQRKTS
jgi:hypothetical protein